MRCAKGERSESDTVFGAGSWVFQAGSPQCQEPRYYADAEILETPLILGDAPKTHSNAQVAR